jgi:hypothetical protein
MKCKHAQCRANALPRRDSVFRLCQRHIDALSGYVNRKPVWDMPGVTTVSRRRYAGAKRMFGWDAS